MSKTPTQDVSAIPIAWASSVGWRANQLMSAEQYRQCLPKNRTDFDVPLYGPDALVNAARTGMRIALSGASGLVGRWIARPARGASWRPSVRFRR